MEIILGVLALLFAVDDLLGERRTGQLENWLLTNASDQATAIGTGLAFTARPALALIPPTATVVLAIPYVYVPRRLWTVPTRVPLWLFLPLAMVAWFIALAGLVIPWFFLDDSLSNASHELRRMSERRAFLWARRVLRRSDRRLRENMKKFPHGPHGPPVNLFIRPAVAAVLLFSMALSIFVPLVAVVCLASTWSAWAVPVRLLHIVAVRLGNPSFIKVGKYVVLLVGFVVLLVHRGDQSPARISRSPASDSLQLTRPHGAPMAHTVPTVRPRT
jgi:hypothetical protein